MGQAIANGQIDAAVTFEPFITLGVEQNLFGVWKWLDEVYPNQQITVVMFSPKFAADTDAARRFMVAYLRGVRDYVDAISKGKDQQAYVDLMLKYKLVKDADQARKLVALWMNPDGYVNVDGLKADLAWYQKNGLVQEQVSVDKLVNNSFVDYAVQQLGKYPR